MSAITHSLINTLTLDESSTISISDNSDESDNEEAGTVLGDQNLCVICLNVREATWLFLPCKHANCCTQCSNSITELGQTCPTCSRQLPNIFKLIQFHFYSSAEISLVHFMSSFSIVFFPINILNSNLTNSIHFSFLS